MCLDCSDKFGPRLTRRAGAAAVAAGLAAAGLARAAGGVAASGDPAAPRTAARDTSAAALEGAPWRLVLSPGPTGALQLVLPDTEITATFLAGQVAGSAGCNRYAGTYRVSDAALTFSPMASTSRLCAGPQGIMEQEAAYLAALQRTAQFDLTGNALALRDDAGGNLLIYLPQPQTPLEGTDWSAEAYNNGRGGVVSLLAETAITARFDGGRVAGSAGCNRYTAAYTLDGGALQIGPAATTRRACPAPPGVMEQEAAYLAALETVRSYRTEGSRLLLETATGARAASFVSVATGAAP